MRMLFMGPPGAGKGTQAALVADHFGIVHLSTGDIFRANVAAGTELGVTAKRYMDAGEYVPDSVTNAMVRARLGETDVGRGFLLDGYPRTVDQVAELDDILADLGTKLDGVVVLQVDLEELITRLLERARTSGRTDDTEDVIRHRQQVYAEQTAPLLALYCERGLVFEVDGRGTVDEVAERIWGAIAQTADES
ncbi:MAG TPA: adenylate kinase [Nocardioidaceae bacterium]|nr:adenylate kinase [Nocardioidaceae bacterium]